MRLSISIIIVVIIIATTLITNSTACRVGLGQSHLCIRQLAPFAIPVNREKEALKEVCFDG